MADSNSIPSLVRKNLNHQSWKYLYEGVWRKTNWSWTSPQLPRLVKLPFRDFNLTALGEGCHSRKMQLWKCWFYNYCSEEIILLLLLFSNSPSFSLVKHRWDWAPSHWGCQYWAVPADHTFPLGNQITVFPASQQTCQVAETTNPSLKWREGGKQ